MSHLKIGDLAREAGITVRTLHHYDKIGLLRPTSGRKSGHRRYNLKDVERLQKIVSLKSFGLSLDEIARSLNEGSFDLLETLTAHEAALSATIENSKKAHAKLRLLIDKLASHGGLGVDEILQFVKEVTAMDQHFTPEQLAKLRERSAKYSEKVKEVERAWPELFIKFEEAMKANLPITDLKVQVLAAEAQHYIDLFTGGDREIEANLDKAYQANQQSALNVWKVSKEVFEYADLARKNLKSVTGS